MTEEFMRENKEKTHFNYAEIINQVYPEEFSSNDNENEYYRTRMEIISKILKNLGIDMNIYEISYNKYEIPIHLAELIFVIAKWIEENGSYQNSTISYLKRNKLSNVSIDDKIAIISNYFDEIAKDYSAISPLCDFVKKDFLTPYFHYMSLDLIIDKLISIRNTIELPLISYNKCDTDKIKNEYDILSKYAEDTIEIFYNKKTDDKTVKYSTKIPITPLNGINRELAQFLFSLKGTSKILHNDVELDDCCFELAEAIEHLEKTLKKINT